jgi:GNAT superfamily N-acetyltransferase
MSIIIRRAHREDCPHILALVKELAEYEKVPDAVTVSPEHFAESGFGKDPLWWAFVAEADHQIVGFALYYIRFSTWKGQRMYLEDILVTRFMRGQGIGKMLFDRLIREAREKKLNGMVWQVLKWNEPAIRFYKKYNAAFDPEWMNGSIEF